MTDCLLTYRFSTDPAPIQVSTPQTVTSARINLGVFGSSPPVYCNKIQIAVPIGSDATDLSEKTPADSVNTPKWTLESVKIVDGSEIGMNAGTNYARYTFQTRDPSDNKIDYDLVFSLVAEVNQSTGQFDYLIRETSGTTNDPGTFTPKDCTFTLSKTTPQFYLQNFVATAPGSPTVPATEFANGADIRFSWESNGTFFQVFEKNRTTPVYAGTATEFTLAPGLQTDTTFFLVASVTGNPAGSDVSGYEPVFLYDALTVTVSNPDLKPKSVSVSGNATIGGTFDVHGTSTLGSTTATDLTVSDSLGVSGTSKFGQVDASNLTASGTLHVSGASTLTNLTASGSLGVKGTSTLNNAVINGALSARGSVSMMQAAVLLASGTHIPKKGIYAKTDGFVVSYIGWPTNVAKMSNTVASIYSSGVWFQDLGGSTGTFGPLWSYAMVPNPSTMCVPARAGHYFYIDGQQLAHNQLDSPISFYWFPTGTVPGGGPTFEFAEPDIAEIPPLPELPVCDISELREERTTKVKCLIGTLEAAFGNSIEEELKQRLLSQIVEL